MARYYDQVYEKLVDYKRETLRIEKIFRKHHGEGKGVRSVLDVACGTGNYSFAFARRGYETIGIDISREMILAAKRKLGKEKTNPRFFEMDMRAIDPRNLHSQQFYFDAATVLFGGFGYLLNRKDVLDFFKSVRERLDNRGLLIFEFWHTSGISADARRPSGRPTWDRTRKNGNLVIRLHLGNYDAEASIMTVRFDFYVLNLARNRIVDTFAEVHRLKTYTMSEMNALLNRGGFKVLGFYEGSLGTKKIRLQHPQTNSFRIIAVASPRK